MSNCESKDAMGQALQAYLRGQQTASLIIKSDLCEDDMIPVHYLFRNAEDMPLLETKALSLCQGNVLDVGAASGAHSLVLQAQGCDVTAIDISAGAVDVMKQRGVQQASLQDFFEIEQGCYDTLLFLMNGVGIAGTLENLVHFLEQAKNLLSENGQILLDSSDIEYMFLEPDGSKWVDLNSRYYGEVVYQMQYQDVVTDEFPWLFVDFARLNEAAQQVGLKCDLVLNGEHFDYLARLSR